VLTTDDADEDIARALQAGATAYVLIATDLGPFSGDARYSRAYDISFLSER
jgi:hypothetical protein